MFKASLLFKNYVCMYVYIYLCMYVCIYIFIYFCLAYMPSIENIEEKEAGKEEM